MFLIGTFCSVEVFMLFFCIVMNEGKCKPVIYKRCCIFSSYVSYLTLIVSSLVSSYRLSAGLFRQATYSTVRLGVFQTLHDKLTE